jgi:hypothetical protein
VKGGRADIVAYEFDQEGRVYFDVSITHPCADSYFDAAEKKAGAAAELRASKKIEKYAKRIEPGSHFIPIVMEAYGRMSNSTYELLRKLFRINEARVSMDPWLFNMYAIQRVSCSLQRTNAILILQGKQKANG